MESLSALEEVEGTNPKMALMIQASDGNLSSGVAKVLVAPDGASFDLGIYCTLEDVPMGFIQGAAFVATLAAYNALKAAGQEDLGIWWPYAVVSHVKNLVAFVDCSAGFGDSMFTVANVHVNLPYNKTLAENIRNQVVGELTSWKSSFAGDAPKAGPLTDVLNEYYDANILISKEVLAEGPGGRALAIGEFCGLDIWGKASLKDEHDRILEFSPENAIMKLLEE